jgi:hypothetical protein
MAIKKKVIAYPNISVSFVFNDALFHEALAETDTDLINNWSISDLPLMRDALKQRKYQHRINA